jgi:hypothetical protein
MATARCRDQFHMNFFILFLSQHNNYQNLIHISLCNNKFTYLLTYLRS